MSKVFSLAAILWAVIASSLFWYGRQSYLMLLAGWFPVLAVVMFVACQIPLHGQMVAFKKRRIREIENAIAEVSGVGFARVNEQQREHMEFLEAQLEKACLLPEWPFGFLEFFAVAASSASTFVPLLKTVTPALVPWMAGLAT